MLTIALWILVGVAILLALLGRVEASVGLVVRALTWIVGFIVTGVVWIFTNVFKILGVILGAIFYILPISRPEMLKLIKTMGIDFAALKRRLYDAETREYKNADKLDLLNDKIKSLESRLDKAQDTIERYGRRLHLLVEGLDGLAEEVGYEHGTCCGDNQACWRETETNPVAGLTETVERLAESLGKHVTYDDDGTVVIKNAVVSRPTKKSGRRSK